jgi:hypothetical protein
MRGWGAGVLFAFAGLAASNTAYSQTWVAPAKTPFLADIVVVDRTGETEWPYGEEDVFGDGTKFTTAEQATDIRTVYASTDDRRLWLRTYFSTASAVGAATTLYVFVDKDKNAETGGSAAQKAINPAFGADPSRGGYEVVLTIKGDGTFGPLWTWNDGERKFDSSMLKPNQGVASVGVDLDPLLIPAYKHGFIQGSVDFDVVGIEATCEARFFVRSVNANGKADATGSKAYDCIPDKDKNDVPVVIVPDGCKTDKDCPDHGVCIDEKCVIAPPCRTDADCKDGDECTKDGRCVPKPAGACGTNDDCKDGLVCTDKMCVACVPESDDCGDDAVCLPTGVCQTTL